MFGRGKPPPIPPGPSGAHRPGASAWHAVDVLPGPFACPEVKSLGARRFLADQAPRLPIPECSTPWRCRCVYRHFADRRVEARRASERGLPARAWLGQDRRQRRGRRVDDGP